MISWTTPTANAGYTWAPGKAEEAVARNGNPVMGTVNPPAIPADGNKGGAVDNGGRPHSWP